MASSNIRTASLVIGEPVVAIGPQLYGSAAVTPLVAGLDIDTAAASSISAVANVAGYRGAIVTCFHSPAVGGGASRTQYRVRHGETANVSSHAYVGEFTFTIAKPGISAGGDALSAPTFLIDTSRTKQFLSIEVAVTGASNALLCVTITPVDPVYPQKSQLDQTTNLFAVKSGDLTFPDLS